MLAATDAAHEDLSGPFEVVGNQQYQRLAGLSVSHLYNLRNSPRYRKQRVKFHHTQVSNVSTGERRNPDPKGKPGYLRIDTVHQGRKDGHEGIFFLNSVDTVTQWQNIGCDPAHQYPLPILGFHSHNGSEFINKRVAQMLNNLLAEFTNARPTTH